VKGSHAFVDEAHISVVAGDGGNGMVSYRREKFVPFGGPNGGDGGRGGDVVLVADRGLNTLTDFHHRQRIVAKKGHDGGSSDKTGARGDSVELRVPVGTVVYDDGAGEDTDPLADLTEHGQRFRAAAGGSGGWGNARFKRATRQTPDFALEGRPGETRRLRLSLKLLADVGLVGFPNAGKSTLLRRLSAAKPKVASYPFTTLTPSLGVVEQGDARFVVADIPGLIEGASEGAGLGHQFLRHVERTLVLVHLLDIGAWLLEGRDPIADYEAIRAELGRYQPELLGRREVVVLNKVDLVADRAQLVELREQLEARGLVVHEISGATGEGRGELVRTMLTAVEEERAAAQALADDAEAQRPSEGRADADG
jgi:GTP-binding protein